jgi:cytochrome c-type biogenesis protein NrfE
MHGADMRNRVGSGDGASSKERNRVGDITPLFVEVGEGVDKRLGRGGRARRDGEVGEVDLMDAKQFCKGLAPFAFPHCCFPLPSLRAVSLAPAGAIAVAGAKLQRVELSTIGHGLLWCACVAAIVTVVTGRRRLLVASALLASGSTAVLAWGFVTSDFRVRAVAEHSRRSVAAPYRLSGLWAGTAPSLLFWSTLALLVAAVAGGPRLVAVAPHVARGFAAIGGAFLMVGAVAADPFERLSLPPVDGTGLAPILEHPAMLVHPPLLYLGALLTLPAFVFGIAGAWAIARRWLVATAAVLTLALALGAWWSYAEQGWGGYWAWDPVENGGLLPWLAAVAAVHVPATASMRWRRGASVVPFTLATTGTWLTRSGAAQSVHAFGEARAVGWGIGVLSIGILAVAVFAVVRQQPGPATQPIGRLRLVQVVTSVGTIVIVAIGTFAPVVWRALGSTVSIRSSFYSRLLLPFAVVALVGSVLAIARRSSTGRRSVPQTVAHIGFVILLAGVAGSLGHRSQRIIAKPGQTQRVLGHDVQYLGSFEPTAARANTEVGMADLRVDGVVMRPSLVRFTTTGDVLVETATSRRWWGDVQTVLASRLPSDVATFDIRVSPLQSLVWLGAVIMAAGLAATLRPGRTGPRRRFPIVTAQHVEA